MLYFNKKKKERNNYASSLTFTQIIHLRRTGDRHARARYCIPNVSRGDSRNTLGGSFAVLCIAEDFPVKTRK